MFGFLLFAWSLTNCSEGLNYGGVVLALQATNAVHLGVDNLNVVRYVGRLLDGLSTIRPFELVDDGDLVILIRKLLSIRGGNTVCISEVKGHADESLVP